MISKNCILSKQNDIKVFKAGKEGFHDTFRTFIETNIDLKDKDIIRNFVEKLSNEQNEQVM